VNARRPALQLASALLVYRWLRRVDAFLSKGWSTIAPQRQPSQPPSSFPTADVASPSAPLLVERSQSRRRAVTAPSAPLGDRVLAIALMRAVIVRAHPNRSAQVLDL
jgi:hypothetical protein